MGVALINCPISVKRYSNNSVFLLERHFTINSYLRVKSSVGLPVNVFKNNPSRLPVYCIWVFTIRCFIQSSFNCELIAFLIGAGKSSHFISISTSSIFPSISNSTLCFFLFFLNLASTLSLSRPTSKYHLTFFFKFRESIKLKALIGTLFRFKRLSFSYFCWANKLLE